MKEKYWRSESDRTALTIILICMAILTAGCILGIIYLTEYGFYKEGDNGKTAKSISVQMYSLEDIEQVEDYYNCRFENNDDIRVEYYRERFSTKTSNFIFSVVFTRIGHYPPIHNTVACSIISQHIVCLVLLTSHKIG